MTTSAAGSASAPHHGSHRPDGSSSWTGRRCAVALAATALLCVPVLASLGASATAAPALSIDQVQQEIDALQTQAEAATEAYDAGRITLAGAQRAAAAADASVTRQAAVLAGQTAGARRLAAAEYRSGGVGKLLTFVGSGNPAAFLEQASTLSSISTSQAEQLEQLKSAAKRLADARTLDAAKQADAAAQSRHLDQTRTHIESLLAQERKVLSGLQEQQRRELAAREAAAAKAAAAAAFQARQVAEAQATAAEQQAANAASAQPANSTATDPASSTTTTTSTVDASVADATGSTSDGSSSASSSPVSIPSSARSSVALSAAYAEMGKPYVYGAAGPGAYDCSGLTMWAFAKAGISLPHSAAAQYGYGTHVSRDQLQPGDLVFFDEGGGIGHVGIYAGGGTMVDAPHSGSFVGVHALYPGFVGGTRL